LVLLAGLVLQLRSFPAAGQSFNLEEYLPYTATSTSLLSSDSGFSLAFNGTSDTGFHWSVSGLGESLRTNFRIDGSGLTVLSETGQSPGEPAYVQTYNPAWNISPALVTAGQLVTSAGSYIGSEPGGSWSGDVTGALTIGNLEPVSTPAGSFDALKLSYINNWMETSAGDSSHGSITQSWWMVRHLGVVKLDYQYAETYSDGGSEAGEFTFQLASSSLLVAPSITNQPVSITVPVGGTASFAVGATGPGSLTYQWQKGAGNPLAGETNATLTLTNVQTATAGGYSVVVSNFVGGVTSAEAVLTVDTSPGGVSIPDPALEAALRVQLNKPAGAITRTDLESLITFSAINQGITNLTGLEFAVNLRFLTLTQNAITNLAPLGGLRNLNELTLTLNQVSDLSPLANATTLTRLTLRANQISDLAPLAGLTNLSHLEVGGNRVKDVSAVAALSQLAILSLEVNRIEDVSPLAGLSRLIGLNLNNNHITDLSPLQTLTNLTSALVAANYLDLTSGSPDRLVIDSWIRPGRTVIYQPQFALPASVISIRMFPAGDRVRLEWNSQAGFRYAVHTSPDFTGWSPLPGASYPGTGSTLSHELPVLAGNGVFVRLELSFE